jgi:alpha-L-arabinofuranosidase
VDEHYYRSPEWFLKNAKRYDNYNRKGPKVFAGEYAAHDRNRNNNLRSALAEAAFMTGLERNADIVQLATYAPLLAHKDAWQWKPDMIWFDNLSVVRTPNYYVQMLYANNSGTNVLPISLNEKPICGQDSLYASAAIDANTSEIILKIVNASDVIQNINIKLKGLKKGIKNNEIKLTTLHTNNPDEINSFETPLNIVPGHASIEATGSEFQLTMPGNAFYLCRLTINL